MLTDLSFLNAGQPWPPMSERARLELYAKNKQLFENEHASVYEEAFKRISHVIGNFEDVVSYAVIVNFQKKISIKTADFLWIEPPKIKAGEYDSPEQKAIDQIIENSDLYNTGYENTLDISRYGDGLLLIYKDGDKGMIDVTQPSLWYPVVDAKNIKRFKYHVLAWTTEEGIGDQKKKHLTVRIHEKGRYTERVLNLITSSNVNLVGDFIDKPIAADKVVPTGLSDFAVIQASNIMTSDRCHGFDDYTDVDSIISELLVRVSQISKVLDKHADPSVQGPEGALEKDPATGEWKLKLGNYFSRRDKDDPPVEYIVWNGQLESAFKQVEKLVNFLAVISEMGSAIFDNAEKTGEAASGTALRLRYISPLAKVKRISLRYGPALIKAIKLCSELGGKDVVKLTEKTINIIWQDGLPDDEKERAEIVSLRTGAKPTMSQQEGIMYLDGKNEEQAAESYAQILEEEAASAPAETGSYPPSQNGGAAGGAAGAGAVEAAEAVTGTTLNGAQVTSLLNVVASVNAGTIGKAAAIEIITSAFGIGADKAERILNNATK